MFLGACLLLVGALAFWLSWRDRETDRPNVAMPDSVWFQLEPDGRFLDCPCSSPDGGSAFHWHPVASGTSDGRPVRVYMDVMSSEESQPWYARWTGVRLSRVGLRPGSETAYVRTGHDVVESGKRWIEFRKLPQEETARILKTMRD
jgi:hypothetical protein